VVDYIGPRLRGLPHEEFHLLALNVRNEVLESHLISRGILDASLVHPREVFAPALMARAAAVIVVHNHPSGDPTPSPEDHRVTQQLKAAGDVLGIRVLDHLVIGNPGWQRIDVERVGVQAGAGAGAGPQLHRGF
jgi:DNA repair protein RadC